jgi:transposase-like protein
MQSDQSETQRQQPTRRQPSRRLRRSREQWIEIVQQYRQSNCTQAEFCRRNGISLATFNKWIHRLRTETESGFVEVTPNESPVADIKKDGFLVRLTLGNGVVLELNRS